MMNRALKAFPGMVITVLLASPAFASSGAGHVVRHSGHADHGARAQAEETRVSEPRRPSVARTNPSATGANGGRVTTATRSRHGGRVFVRREAPSREAFVNDATAWSEPGVDLNASPDLGASLGGGIVHGGAIVQVGMASWYGGSRWQGHLMSSGGRFDDAKLTAAHATLPLGSRVLVSLNGGARAVIVTITDRPGTRRRIIDLSRAAAAELGILDRGVAQVSLTLL